MPLIVQSTKQTTTSFNLSIINSHMQIAKHGKATLAETKVAIVNMYQNGTTAKISSQAQNAALALANYIYANKASKKFAFVLGKDHQDQQLLLLTISSYSVKTKTDASLQRDIQQALTSIQKQEVLFSVKQLSWVSKALKGAEFGILFWIYQHRLSSQEALLGTTQVPAPITAVNFQRAKTPYEQLQDEAWAKTIAVIQKLNSRQLKIQGNAHQLPSQIKTFASHIVLAIQKIITSDNKISKAASKLIKEDNIEVQPVDKTGAMIVTMKNYGHDKIIAIFGFKATGTPLEVAQAKINAAKDGANLPTKLIKVLYRQRPRASDVNAPTKEGVTFKFKSATIVNNRGESTLTYEVDVNPQVKGTIPQDLSFVVSGFETQAQARERITQLAQIAIQNLVVANFTTGINKAQIASSGKPLKAHVIKDIKKQISNRDAQALILPSDITITSNNMAQSITIVIHNHGLVKTITIARFSSIVDYLDQVLSAIPSLGGALVIPEGITSTQFDGYVKGMGVANRKYKFAEQYKSKIISLTIPSSFTTIASWFEHFNRITSLTIPNSVITIEINAFYKSPLTTLSLGDHLLTIGRSAFYDAKLTSLIIPNAVTTIGDTAFSGSLLTTLSLGDQLKTIGGQAFVSAQLTSLRIPNAVTTLGTGAFQNSPLTSLTLGNQLKTIGHGAFKSALLTSLRIPNAVITIGRWAFLSSPLKNVNIFQDVKFVDGSPFKGTVTIKWIPRLT